MTFQSSNQSYQINHAQNYLSLALNNKFHRLGNCSLIDLWYIIYYPMELCPNSSQPGNQAILTLDKQISNNYYYLDCLPSVKSEASCGGLLQGKESIQNTSKIHEFSYLLLVSIPINPIDPIYEWIYIQYIMYNITHIFIVIICFSSLHFLRKHLIIYM